ncbi:MOSC domain-containing protein [Actinomadura sp. ATCC 31491]|uniref:MOSC domain-containing protein n=1 Tax=Actinomadura luzonensis TaxID=2805427 RepID=A0ABT0FYI9_9ACTN|nr:MOSC N-terminal beta barrel domain-containing protein [Actinomadura luzonensis]MCK2217421.1 MOSC domain-containing protein [Actinomadura luzonensis]
MKLASIHYYPVKSTAGHDTTTAEVQPWGLAGDRRYVITDERGYVLTARERPRLLACVAELDGDRLTLTGPHAAPLPVTPAGEPGTGELSTIVMGGTPVAVTDCGDDAAAWLSELAGQPVRLKWLDDPTRRPVESAYGRPEDRVSLADGFPLLLTTAASLARLNEWVAEGALERGEEPPAPLAMRRFRPNVVVDGADAFAEDEWKRVRIGAVDFRVTKGCDRCVLTTVDPETYTKGKEPIRTLSRHRKWDGKVWFGVNLIPDTTGRITVGDSIAIL